MAVKKSSEVALAAAEPPVVVPAVGQTVTDTIAATESATAQAAATQVAVVQEAVTKAIDTVVHAPTVDAVKTPMEAKVNMEKMMKTAEEFVSFGQGNLEAFAKSGQIWAAGLQDLGKHVAATTQAQMEHTVATMKALAGVKSLKEAIDLQSNLARASVEKAMTETGKFTDASLKLAEQTMAPITARVTLAMEKFGRSV